MKKHLFYTFLWMFIITFVVTLLGITKTINIDDGYLKPLFWLLLGELVGAVIGIYRGTNFFDESATSTTVKTISRESNRGDNSLLENSENSSDNNIQKQPIDLDGEEVKSSLVSSSVETNYSNHTLSQTLEKASNDNLNEQPIDLEEYFTELKKLSDRFLERDKLQKETDGKFVEFIGIVFDVGKSSTGYVVTTDSNSDEMVFIYLPSTEESHVYSLKRGDAIKVQGIVETESSFSVTIRAKKFDLVLEKS